MFSFTTNKIDIPNPLFPREHFNNTPKEFPIEPFNDLEVLIIFRAEDYSKATGVYPNTPTTDTSTRQSYARLPLGIFKILEDLKVVIFSKNSLLEFIK